MRGWILDIYPDLRKEKMVLWIRGKKRCYKIIEDYDPLFYVRAKDGDYTEVKRFYEQKGFDTRFIDKRCTIYADKKRKILEISPDKVFDPRKQADALDFFDGYENYEFYNVDIPLDQRYLIENNIKPFSLIKKDDGWRELEEDVGIHYSKPNIRTLTLEAEINSSSIPSKNDKLSSIKLGEERMEGREGDVLKALDQKIEDRDPDVIVTSGGDSFLIPYLSHRARINEVKLMLGREKSTHPPKDGSSYRSYGRVIYKPPTYPLKGRVHIDMENSFLFREGGVDGLIEVSRLSKMPLQKLSRRSPGSAINAMELEQAMKEGYLIPWKKNINEKFKTARQLIKSDRGGHMFEPEVGIHTDVIKLDFASMYPSIIDRYNLSPETLNCDCGNYHVVPELGYRVCDKEKGLIPKVVAPIVERRQDYKKRSKDNKVFSRRADTLKWLLVTCFGYTGYKKARFSNIEVHESVTAYGREILITAADMAEKEGFEVIHGIVDSLWLKEKNKKGYERIDELLNAIKKETKVKLEDEGRYSWVAFLPSRDEEVGVPNRYFGVIDDELEMKGIHARRSDTPVFFKSIQKDILKRFQEAESKKGLESSLPNIFERIGEAFKDIKNERVSLKELYFKKIVSKKAYQYDQLTENKAALLHFKDMGVTIHPGETIRYIVTDEEASNHHEKVKVEGEEISHYDTGFYQRYLFRITEEILIPFGYDRDKIRKKIIHN